jgi:ribosomal protein L10
MPARQGPRGASTVEPDAELADQRPPERVLSPHEGLEFRGGALDGSRLEAGDIKAVAKWPSRAEQLSILSGQISSLASILAGQIGSMGGVLAGQISSRVDDLEKGGSAEAAAEA